MQTIAQPQTNIKLSNLPARFSIERLGEQYTITYPTGTISKMERTRFRHHGSRKWRDEFHAIPQYQRIPVTKEVAQSLHSAIAEANPHADCHISDYGNKHVVVTFDNPLEAEINQAFETARLADARYNTELPTWSIGTDTFIDYDALERADLMQTLHDASYAGQW